MPSSSQVKLFNNLKRGDIVIADFPYDNEEGSKDRRAVILGRSDASSFLLCMITKNSIASDAIPLGNSDLSFGRLGYDPSYIRPKKIQTLRYELVDNKGKVGSLKEKILEKVMKSTMSAFTDEVSLTSTPRALERPKKRVR